MTRIQELSSSLASDSARELNILRHDGDALGVNGTEIGVLEESNQISLSSFLQRGYSTALEPQICFEILCDLAHETLEGKLSDQQLGAFLILSDLPQRHRTWPESVRLLHTAGRRSRLPCSLCGQLLPRSLASSGLASCLLGSCHCREREKESLILWEIESLWRECKGLQNLEEFEWDFIGFVESTKMKRESWNLGFKSQPLIDFKVRLWSWSVA